MPLALVTGASSGIGLELAKELARKNYQLLITAETEQIEDIAQEISKMGVPVETCVTDLRSYEGVEKLCEKLKSMKTPVHVAALNAGVGVYGDFARETILDEELKLIQLNVVSTVHLSKRLLQDMLENGQGRVLFTASIAGTMPGPLFAVYAASKAFIISFAEALRFELKDTNIHITALMPGPTDTNFFKRADMEESKAAQGKLEDPAVVAREAIEALMKDKDHIVVGTKNKLQAVAGHMMSEEMKARVQAQQTRPVEPDSIVGS